MGPGEREIAEPPSVRACAHLRFRGLPGPASAGPVGRGSYRNADRARSASSRGAAERSYRFTAGVRGGYVTEGQCCSGTHFPCTCMAPTAAPQTAHVWIAHCSRFLFRVRTSCNSSLNRPSHGFNGVDIILLFTSFRCARPSNDFLPFGSRPLVLLSLPAWLVSKVVHLGEEVSRPLVPELPLPPLLTPEEPQARSSSSNPILLEFLLRQGPARRQADGGFLKSDPAI